MNEHPSLDKPTSGSIRFNTDSSKLEIYDGNAWFEIDSTSPELQTGGTRGIFAGGYTQGGGDQDEIEFINVSTTGNAQDFGNLSISRRQQGGSGADRTRSVFMGGRASPLNKDTIDFITIASTGDATDFGNLTSNRWLMGGGVSSGTRSVFAGGSVLVSGNPSVNTIDYVTTQSLGNAVDFGDHIQAKRLTSSVNSPTRGIFAGGYADSSPYPRYNIIEFITTATLGNCQDFVDLTSALSEIAGVCNATRGMIAGNGSPASKVIEVITIATLGNSARFGELSAMSHLLGGASSPIRGVYAGGYNPSSGPNTIGAAGGSGIVILRAPSARTFAVTPGTNSTSTHPGGDKLATFTVSGTLTVT